jgi:predicted oxidoreductase
LQTYTVPNTTLTWSRLGYGCMQMGGKWDESPLTQAERTRAAALLDTAVEAGITLFDHADIYTRGKSETVFGEALQQRPGLREKILLQSKCGIRFANSPNPGDPGRFDFSREHILRSVEGSLRRLQTDYLDVLLLHRPDPLVEPEEVARAFDELQAAGKVRHFGVSNHTPGQMALLQKYVRQPIVVNQLELNLVHSQMIEDGVLANQTANHYTGQTGILDYCRLHGILIQAWAPVANGKLIDPPRGADERTRKAAAAVKQLAEAKGTTREAIALAWLMRHPAGVQPIIGTTNVERLRQSVKADAVTLSREEWYGLWVAARGPMP